ERGLGGDDVDLAHRLDRLRRDRSRRAEDARAMARRWADAVAPARSAAPTRNDGQANTAPSLGSILALAYPDRVARHRGGGPGAFLLARGRGAKTDPASALAREPYLAVAEIIGSAAQGRIVLAAAIAPAEIEARFADRIEAREEVTFDPPSASLRGRRLRRLGATPLPRAPIAGGTGAGAARAPAAGLAASGVRRLPPPPGAAP